MLFRWGENGKSARLECRRKMAWRSISPAALRSSRPSPAAAWRHRNDVPVGRWRGAQYGGAVGLHPVSRNEHGGERLGRQIGDANLKMTASGDGIVTLKSDVQCSCKIRMPIAQGPLPDRQRAFIERLGLSVAALSPIQQPQIIQADGLVVSDVVYGKRERRRA